MCVLAILLEPGRILAAANRDEALDRPSAPPAEVEPGVVAGRDLLAGGAWLGYNRHGLFVAVTNRTSPPSTPAAFSRGLMVREALRYITIDDLRAGVERRVAESPVAGFNLVAVVAGRALALLWDGRLRAVELGLGAHVVSSDRDVDDPSLDERIEFERFLKSGPADPERLPEFLSSHEGARPVCKHGERFGTVSSSVYEDWCGRSRLWHAQGAPCRTPFELLQEL